MAYTVAEAEVSVTPDARNFGRDLRAQIVPEAEKIGRDIGDDLVRGLRERLATAHPDVNVGADTTEAKAKVDTFLAETKAKAAVAGRESGRSLGKNMADEAGAEFSARGALIGSAIALGLMAGAPLVVAAGGVLIGGLAAVIVHQAPEVENAANEVAHSFTDAFQKAAVNTIPMFTLALKQVSAAAQSMAGTVKPAFDSLQPAIEGVTHGVLGLVQQTLPGLVQAIQAGAPVFAGLATALTAIGTGLGNFFSIVSQHSDAMGTSLAAVGTILQQLLTALGTLAGAGSELGSQVLPMLSAALGVVNDVLQFLAPVLPGVAIGFAAFKIVGMLAPLLGTFAGQLDTIGIKALIASDNLTLSRAAGSAAAAGFGAAASGARGLEAAMGPIGWILAGISIAVPLLIGAFNNQKAAQQQVKDSAQAMTAALQESKGAIDDNVRATAALEAQKNGLLDYAKTWGVAGSTVVDAMLGVPGAMETVNAAATRYQATQTGAAQAIAQAQLDADPVQRQYNTGAGEEASKHEDAAAASKNHLNALGQLAGTTAGEVKNQADLKAAIEGSNNSLQANTERLQGIANGASAASGQVNILKTALDNLTGKAVSLGDAEVAVTNAVLAASTAMKGKTGALTDGTGAVNLHTEAGAALWSSMTAIASADNKVIATMLQHGATTAEVTQRDAELRGQFVQTAIQMGLSAGEAENLATQIYGIPAERKTEISADASDALHEADLVRDALSGLHDKDIMIRVTTQAANYAAAAYQGYGPNAEGNIWAAGGQAVERFASGGLMPNMSAGTADIVAPNTWRVIGDRSHDDEAYIPINDSARSLAILARTAGRMGYGLTDGRDRDGGTRTDARSYVFQISAPSDPYAIAREVREAQRDLEFLHG